MSPSDSDERPDWPRFQRWSEMPTWKRYLLVGLAAFVLLLVGFGTGMEIARTGRVWPSVRPLLLSLPLLGAFALAVGFYKVRRVGATLLSAAGLVALLAAIWWAVPAERGLVLTVGGSVTQLSAGGLVFVLAVYGRVPAALGSAGGLLGLLYGVPWAVPTLPAPAQTFVDAGIEGVLWLGTAGFVLHGAERAGLLTLPWRDEGDTDAPRAPAG